MGLANQTTMLRDETLSIGKLLEKTMMEKYGPAALKEHYMVMDTICDATQVCSCDRSLGWRPPVTPHRWVAVVVLVQLG